MVVTLQGSTENSVVSFSGITYYFVSRYFAPWNGIPEDPVTGPFEFFAKFIAIFLKKS